MRTSNEQNMLAESYIKFYDILALKSIFKRTLEGDEENPTLEICLKSWFAFVVLLIASTIKTWKTKDRWQATEENIVQGKQLCKLVAGNFFWQKLASIFCGIHFFPHNLNLPFLWYSVTIMVM